MNRRALRPLALLAALTFSAPAVADEPLAAWADSAVRYLLDDGQRGRYRALTTDAERSRFIEEFWRALDPEPESPENEARATFEARLVEADRRFREPGVPGWRTDRGHVFLLWGPPDDELEDIDSERERVRSILQDPETATTTETRPRLLTWIYLRPPGHTGRQDVVFEENARGGFRRVSAVHVRWGLGDREVAAAAEPPEGREADARAIARLLDRARRGRSIRATHMRARALAYPGGGDRALVVVAFALTRADTPTALELLAGAYSGDALEPSHAWRMPFTASSADRTAARSFAALLPPGHWQVQLVVRAPDSTVPIAHDRVAIDVPDFASGELEASSLLLAQGFRMLDSARVRLHEVVDDVVVGKVVVDARPGLNVPREPPPQLFLVVAGAEAADGRLDVSARFRVIGADGRERLARAVPIVRPFHAQPIPVADLAPGVYDVEVDLEDRASGRRTRAAVRFDLD